MLSSVPLEASSRSSLLTERSTAVGPRRSRPVAGESPPSANGSPARRPSGVAPTLRAHRHVRRDGVEAGLIGAAADRGIATPPARCSGRPSAQRSASTRSSSLPYLGARLIRRWRSGSLPVKVCSAAPPAVARRTSQPSSKTACRTAARLSATLAICTPCDAGEVVARAARGHVHAALQAVLHHQREERRRQQLGVDAGPRCRSPRPSARRSARVARRRRPPARRSRRI